MYGLQARMECVQRHCDRYLTYNQQSNKSLKTLALDRTPDKHQPLTLWRYTHS